MTLINLLADFVECSVGDDSYVFRRALAKALMAPRRKFEIKGSMLIPELDRLHKAAKTTARLEWLCALDVKLWKAPKLALRRVLMAVHATGEEIRVYMSRCYPCEADFSAALFQLVQCRLQSLPLPRSRERYQPRLLPHPPLPPRR